MKAKFSALIVSMFAAAAVYAAGDIYEIRPCDEFGNTRGAYATYADPITSVSADSYFFTLRLQVRDAGGQNPNVVSLKRYYRLVHTNPYASEEYDASVDENRFGIGVFVSGKVTASGDLVDSGKLEYANLVQIVPNSLSGTNFFDCVFEYKLKPGHFSLPVRLAVEDTDSMTGVTTIRPANDSLDNCTYHFRNTDKWEVRYIDTEVPSRSDKPAVWTITGENTPRLKPNGTTGYTPAGDYSLAGAGLYVQTVDFDQTAWEGVDFWREVPMGDEIRCPVKAFAEASGVAEDTTLYVWSMDETAVKVVGGESVEIITNKIGTVDYKTVVTIGTISIRGGTATADFDVLGVMSNRIASIVMSSWKGFRYNVNNNTRVIDYKTIPVKCGDMPVPSVEISFNKDYPKAPSSKSLSTTASTNFFDRAADAIPLYVTLTQPHDSEVTVGVTVKYEADDTLDPIAERFISVSDNGEEFFETDMYRTNVTFAAGETQKTLYVYPLGGNADTKTSGISFTPAIVSSATPASYEIGKPSLLKIDSTHIPVIFVPENNHDYGIVSGAAGEGFDIELFVNDCFRDMKNTNGFLVTFGGALKGQSATNVVFSIGEALDMTITGYPKKTEGQQKGTITVQEPGGSKKAQVQVFFTVAVEKDKLVYVDLYKTTAASSRCDETQFAEGEAPIPMFYVNEPMAAGESIYFFLRPCNEASSNLVSCAAFTQGVELVGGQTNTVRSSAFALNFLDGCADTEIRSLEYEIFARTAPTLDAGSESIIYAPAQKLVINVANVRPTVQAVKVNNASEAVENNPSAIWKHTVSASVPVPFQAKLSDPSDLFDVSNGLVTVWCFTEGRSSSTYKYEFNRITNGADIVTVDHEFTYAGGSTQDVKVVVLDKDMMDSVPGVGSGFTPTTQAQIAELWTAVSDKTKPYYAEPYQFRVSVGKKPCVKVLFPDNDNLDTVSILENTKSGTMAFELTEAADEDLEIKVTVSPLNEDGNPGKLEFQATTFVVREGNTEPSRSTTYNNGIKFKYGSLDGTAGSYDDGFYVTVEVVTDCEHGKDYYEKGEGWVYIRNTRPVITPSQPEFQTTNMNVAVGQPFELVWKATDVAADLEYVNPLDPLKNGLVARWYDNGAEIKNARTNVSEAVENTTTLVLRQEGFHEIRLEVVDKEGEDCYGKATRSWFYYIEPTKKLQIRAFGPSTYTESYYDAAPGLGKGRVYADGSLANIIGFVQTWSYGISVAESQAYAVGYAQSAAPYADDGSLSARDAALAPNGDMYESGAYYMYDGDYDNYFYRWIYVGSNEGGASTSEYSKVSILTDPKAEVISSKIALDPYVNGKNDGYRTRQIEAVFSREMKPQDNLGDINADGVPDLYTKMYRFDVFDDKGNLIGDDIGLDNVNGWDDGDYLPASTTLSVQVSWGLTNTWNIGSLAFTPAMEIRGYDGENGHFNDAYEILAAGIGTGKPMGLLAGVTAEKVFTMPYYNASTGVQTNDSTLSEVEYVAFTNYCAKMGWDPADEAHWGLKDGSYDNSWSPERPTDPTKADTDGDLLSDGFEYFLWYRAHVGELVDGKLVRLTGSRYNQYDPGRPVEISSEEIERLFDPLTKAADVALRDTDNDGLTDLEEFALGTDPINWDTDGDGLPDGWEVHYLHSDPLKYATVGTQCDALMNEDHDAMAWMQFKMHMVAELILDDAGKIIGTNNVYLSEFKFETTGGADTNRYLVVDQAPDFLCYTGWVYGVNGPWALQTPGTTNIVALTNILVSEDAEVDVVRIHYQVYHHEGFDPRTGWNMAPCKDNHIVNTKDYTALDEFLLQAFYWRNHGMLAKDMEIKPKDSVLTLWAMTCTDPNKADTDDDSMPDGWELYVQVPVEASGNEPDPATYGPTCAFSPKVTYSPVGDVDPPTSGDGLLWPEEFAGVESCYRYRDCPTITNPHPEWQNKVWPTDPWANDTDGDGVPDGEELKHFVYGDKVRGEEEFDGCIEGGGLNPNFWDTDADMLPDPWEVEFKGAMETTTTPASTNLVDNADGTVTTNVVDAVSDSMWGAGMNGTVNDAMLDYDNDGLKNWQEYMVGTMRCWRYDDTITTWTVHEPDLSRVANDEYLYGVLVDPSSPDYNPGFRGKHVHPGVYMSWCNNKWDPNYGKFYYLKDGIYHDLRIEAGLEETMKQNRWHRMVPFFPPPLFDISENYPGKYICTDPRERDTDEDGMDDFYELFHGLNPLYGNTRDIVYESWLAGNGKTPWSGLNNYWTYSIGVTRPDYQLRLKGVTDTPFDFFQYPWLAGDPTADPDGDNIRNNYESIMSWAQAQSTFLHTDPTPLWMTDISYPDSLTYRFYYNADPFWNLGGVMAFIHPTGKFTHTVVDEFGKEHKTTYELNDFPWLHWDADTGICEVNYDINYWNILDTMYSFEQTEGYDTDGDYLGDFEESQGKTKSASNPQDFDDPLRRQAMYFGGKEDPGFLQTSLSFSEQTPAGGVSSEDHMFLYFTVECWAKPDASDVGSPDLQALVERPIWTGPANAADESYLRKNFLIGLKGGRWYTRFDSTGTDSKQAVEITDGPAASTNWTHVAATYDGVALKLYVNGVCCNIHKTSIQPEHGFASTHIDINGLDREDVLWSPESGNRAVAYEMISILIGADAKTAHGIAPDLAWHERNVMMGVAPYYFNTGSAATVNDYSGFFKGYIDEVRIWDGARPAADILSDVKSRKRYTREDALANRSKVLGEIRSGRGRSPLSTSELSAELRYHWSFDHMPGAVDAADVAALPAGFKTSDGTTDGMAVWARPVKDDGTRWITPWLTSIDPSIRSRVYTDLAWVPWVRNTVSHLPRIDGLTRDSLYWAENFAGGVPATDNGVPRYDFARTAEPQCSWYQQLYVRPDGTIYSQDYPTYTGDLYQFTLRESHTEGDDLITLGGAYARRISATEGGMWDDLGAADAWAETKVDSDHNGLPDWWEQYARQNLSPMIRPWDNFKWDTTVIYNGLEMPAWRAYLRDLANGLLPDGEFHDGTNGTLDYRDTRDLDHDGMPDWWEDMYGIDTGSVADAKADPDHDGLSNYQEYRIERDALYMLNPALTRTFVGQVETDYFLQTTNADGRAVYLGELYADHDFMEDDQEDVNGYDRTRYDAYADPDEDGWSNFAEMRYAGFKMDTAARFATHYFAETEVKDYPIPVVHATLRYHGDTGTGGTTNMIYVEAYSGNNLQKSPSAVYAVTPGSIQSRTIYLGEYSDRVFHGTLTPGHVQAGKDNIQLEGCFIQQNDKWTWLSGGVLSTGSYEEMYRAFCADPTIQVTRQENQWFQLQSMLSSQAILQISVDDKTQKGYLYLDYARVGEIDMITGDFSIDLTPIRDYFMVDTLVTVPQLFFRINYKAMLPTMQNNKLSISLAQPDQGVLSEGKTAFVAWMDKDGDGVYTPGVDPIGFAKDVDVGWDQVPAIDIELTDASQAAGQRFSYATASNDTVRVVRIGVNGNTEGVQPRIIFSRSRAAMPRDYVFEGDLVSGGKYGLDWDNLRADLQAMEGIKLKDVTSVEYAVVDGACSMQNLDTNLFITTFSVEYTSEAIKPTAYSPSEKADGIVETVRPTFRWTGADGYTAFRLQIYDAAGSVKLYDSDVKVLPARDSSSRYYWTAPVFIGTNVTADAWALDNHKSYKWRVAMYNQKFSETTDGASMWSDWATMRAELADTNDKSTLYGTVKAVVKYFGPATNSLDQVVVQLFKNADLTGTPAAQTRLFDVSGDISDLTNGIEVAFHGLEDGDYYACAFIDRNGDCVRQRYETWGYSAQVGLGYANIWNPLGVKSEADSVQIPSATVYMEDTDVNGDDLLDWDQDEELLKAASTSASESALAGDSDGDGLSDFEEGDKSYTKANMWDTDGDGMPDGWEYLFAGTDPLTPDADKVVVGDLMAYAEYASRVITARSTATGAEVTYIIPGTNEYYIGDNVNGEVFFSTYDYNGLYGRGKLVTVEDSEAYNLATVTNTLGGAEYKVIFEIGHPVIGVGTNVNEETAWIPEGPDGGPYILGPKTNLNVSVLAESNIVTAVEAIDISLGENRVVSIDDSATVALVHGQVYDEFGFTQTTAVDPSDEHTKPFTALDKYLVIRYLSAIGIGPGEEEINRKRLWKYYSLIPTVTDGDGISDLTDDKSAIKQVKDATDKYGDGIADGWELYVMFGTNGVTNVVASATMKPAETDINPWKYGDRGLDVDGDALDLVHEYSGGKDPSDPWDPYSVYKLILAEGVIEAETLPFLDSEVRRFGVKKDDIDGDWDLDMISNGQEVWGYYKDRVALADICETNAWSDGFTPDYFRALTSLTPVAYLGEIYNGAEFIEPQVRKLFGIQDLQRAGTRDLYNAGWDIWSIVRGSIYKREQTGTGDVSEELSYCVKFLYAVWPDEFTGTTQDDVIRFVNDHYNANAGTLDDVISTLGGMDYIKRIVKEHAANSFDVAGYEIPEPEVNVKFRYYGNDAHDIVVEAYQVSSTYPERGEQLTASWSVAPLFDSGTAYVTLKATGKGTLKQGHTRFVAYIDNDGSGSFTAGDTFAVTTANIGFTGAYVEMTLGDPNPGFPAFTFNDGSNFISQIKVVRTHINGKPLIDPHTVFFRSFANNAQRQVLFPDDYIWWGHDEEDANYIGLDRYLPKYKNTFGGIDTVTYEILEGVGPYTVSNLTEYAVLVSNQTAMGWVFSTNIVQGTGSDNKKFTVNYSRIRDLADVQVTADQLAGGDVNVSFTVPNDTPATKFWLDFDGDVYPNGSVEIKNYAGSYVTYTRDTGYPVPPAANGFVTINLAEYIGADVDPGTYTVRIRLGNDLFDSTGDDGWSGEAEFSVGAASERKGRIDVIVKHPVADVGNITVAVYDRPDFANPVSEVKVDQSLDSVIEFQNLRENGEYYVAAWSVKNDGDGRVSREVRMPYDTWGYVSMIGTVTNGFNALAITAASKVTVTNCIWLQDTDWNDNGRIDRQEDFVDRDSLYIRGRGSNIIYKDDFDLDGLPDSYEEETEDDDDEDVTVTGKDVMAYYEVQNMLFVGLSHDGGDSNLVWCAVFDRNAVDNDFTLTDGSVQLQSPASALGMLYSTYDYYNSSSPRTDSSKWQGIGTNVTYDSSWTVQRVRTGKAKFVHAQVYTLFGFNPKTCVGDDDAVNTKNFTRNDKYLVCRYLEAIGVKGVVEKNMDTTGKWIWSLKSNNKLDQDRDSVADGWELYVMFGPDPAKYALATGAGIVAADLTNSVPAKIISPFDVRDGQAYSYDDQALFPGQTNRWLKIVQEFDGGHYPTDPWNADTDKDGIRDAAAFKYMLKGEDGKEDYDGDGLDNYVEYMLSEVFDLKRGGASLVFDPRNPFSVNANVSDYFWRLGNFYVGEIFTDHDRMDDQWERMYLYEVSPDLYDADGDPDHDGWSNFAEFQAGTDPTLIATVITSGVLNVEFPVPTVELSLNYEGNQNIIGAQLVVKAWTDPDLMTVPDAVWIVGKTEGDADNGRNSGDAEDGGDATVAELNAKLIMGGKVAKFYLTDAEDPTSAVNSRGHVMEGRNTFIAFYDLDGDGKYTAGEPYGFARDVDVGWNHAEVRIELSDTSAVSPRFNTQDGTNDREVLYGRESGNYDPNKVVLGNVSGGKYERVRVVRTMIDDRSLSDLGVPARVVLDKEIYIDDEQLYITEADFLKDGGFDIDWDTLADDIAAGRTEGMALNSVGYRIVLGNGTVKNSETNNLLSLVFRRQFDVEDVYTAPSQKPVCIGPGVVTSASPTFSWYIPNGLNSYTAFEINVYDGNTKVWGSGYQLMPARVHDDTYGWRYDWKAPIFAGDKLPNGKVFKNGVNYEWEVRVTNARFKNIANWSNPGQFRMNVLANSMDYGVINAAVRHYGPTSIRSKGVIRVQAFKTPDFSGMPIGQGYVADLSAIASTAAITSGNAKIIGLPAGDYYLRAFIDSNNDGVCQNWETWGFTCVRDDADGLNFTPLSVRVGPEVGNSEAVAVYLEDSDTDQDNLPDAWEYVVYGSLDKAGTSSLDEALPNGVAVKKDLAGAIATKGDELSNGLSAKMRTLASSNGALLAMGGDVEPDGDVTAALLATVGRLDEDSTVVSIGSIVLDAVNRRVHVEIDGDLKTANSPIYEFSASLGKTYEFKLLHKSTLMDAEWKVVQTISLVVGSNKTSCDIPVDGDVDLNSGFFMIAPSDR